jgi:hypothetical protein
MPIVAIYPPSSVWSNTKATSFDGIEEHVNIDTLVSPLSTTTKGTWTGRVKMTDATPAAYEYLVSFSETADDYGIKVAVGTAGKLWAMVEGDPAGGWLWVLQTDAQAFTSGVYAHWGLIQDGVEPVIKINNVKVAQTFLVSGDKTFWFNDIPTIDNGRLGNMNYDGAGEGYHLDGLQDEMRFWNTNLSDAQFTTHYNGGTPLDPLLEPLQGNLVTPYGMGDTDTYPTITGKDGYHGTMVNMSAGNFVEDV